MFTNWDSSYLPDAPHFGLLFWTGILYVGYNLAVYPASFFTYRNIRSRKESIAAGFVSGALMTIPWFLTYFALLSYYPSQEVSSRQGEFHPKPLTEPYVIVSHHTALVIHRGYAP
jgi:uncharacterized membrane protein YkvI